MPVQILAFSQNLFDHETQLLIAGVIRDEAIKRCLIPCTPLKGAATFNANKRKAH
jgi:hypothetical protein